MGTVIDQRWRISCKGKRAIADVTSRWKGRIHCPVEAGVLRTGRKRAEACEGEQGNDCHCCTRSGHGATSVQLFPAVHWPQVSPAHITITNLHYMRQAFGG